jgi:hypothetical protein
VIAIALCAMAMAGACGAATPGQSATPSPAGATTPGRTPVATPTPAAVTIADRYHERVTTAGPRFDAYIDGWFITKISEALHTTSLYPVSGALRFTSTNHHLVVAMPEPEGIRFFEQKGGRSSLLDAIRAPDLTIVGPETIDGRTLTVLRAGPPVDLAAFGDVDAAAGPLTGTLQILVDDEGFPLEMRLSSESDGEVGGERLTFTVVRGNGGSALLAELDWTPFESARYGYTVDVPADFEQATEGALDEAFALDYGGWTISRDDLAGSSAAAYFAHFFNTAGDADWGEPTSVEEYLTVGTHDEGHGIIATFHFERDGDQQIAINALISDGDHMWVVTWHGFVEHEIADRTMMLQLLSSWRFTGP